MLIQPNHIDLQKLQDHYPYFAPQRKKENSWSQKIKKKIHLSENTFSALSSHCNRNIVNVSHSGLKIQFPMKDLSCESPRNIQSSLTLFIVTVAAHILPESIENA